MVAPINYALDVASPFTAAAQGMQFGASIQAMQAQRAELAAKQAQEQEAMRRMQAAEAMRARFFSNPNPTMRDAAELAGALPKDQADAMRPYIEQMSKEQQRQQLQFGLQTLHALESNPAMGVKMLRDRAATERASGREQQAALFEQFAESAEKNGPQAPFKILAAMVGHLPGAKEAMEIAGKSRETQADDEFRALMAGVETPEQVFERIPGLAQLGRDGLGIANQMLTQQRLRRDAASTDAAFEAESAKAEADTMRSYGALRLVFQDKDAFTLQKTAAGSQIVPGGMWSDMQKTQAAVADLPKKKKLLGMDDETITAIQYLATTDPQSAGKMIAGAISARIKQQMAPAKMSPDALRLTEAGYEYGSPEFRAQMQQEVTAGRTGRAKGAGTTITNIMPGTKEAITTRGKEFGKFAQEALQASQSADDVASDIDLVVTGLRGMGGGPVAGFKSWAGQYLPAESQWGKMASMSELASTIQAKLAPTMRAAGSGATSDFEMKAFMRAIPTISTTEAGRELMLKYAQKIAERAQVRAEVVNDIEAEGRLPSPAEIKKRMSQRVGDRFFDERDKAFFGIKAKPGAQSAPAAKPAAPPPAKSDVRSQADAILRGGR